MRKKIVIIAVIAVVLVGGFFILHRQFSTPAASEPRTVTTTDDVITHSISLNSLSESSKSSASDSSITSLSEFSVNNPGKHVFFLRDDTKDSDYIIETLLVPLSKEQKQRPTPDIVSIDLSNEKDLTVTRLNTLFSVPTYPAFVFGEYDAVKNVVIVESSLVFDASNPFTADQLRAWFFENDLWTGPYSE